MELSTGRCCDVRSGNCNSVTVSGFDFVDTDDLSCHYKLPVSGFSVKLLNEVDWYNEVLCLSHLCQDRQFMDDGGYQGAKTKPLTFDKLTNIFLTIRSA